jgi:tripartite-type tricarboxylate transporter receptor subunit TctC
MQFSHRAFLHLTAVAAFFSMPQKTIAQEWPTRPITLVVPFAAGGPVDAPLRLLAARATELLGQQIVIEFVGGAGGMIGSNRVAKAAPDGQQFLYGNVGTHAQNQALYKRPLYDAATDFAPVGLIWTAARVLVVRKDLPANTLSEFVAYTKVNHQKMQFGSSGAGSSTQIACLLLNSLIGAKTTHVAYRGTALAMQDLVASRIDYLCDATQTALPHIQAGTVKALAVLSPTRTRLLPNLPTAHEQGLTNLDMDAWGAFFLPKGTPQAIVGRVNSAVGVALDTPAVSERLRALDLRVTPPEHRSPAYLADLIPNEIAKWAPAIKASSATVE